MDSRVKIVPSAGVSREGAFHAARSHSRLVRFLKFAVPTVAVAGMALFVFFAWFNPFRAQDLKVNVGQVGVSGGRLVMELPHLTGFNKRQQSYNVTASTASQKVTAPGLIDLTRLDAVITTSFTTHQRVTPPALQAAALQAAALQGRPARSLATALSRGALASGRTLYKVRQHSSSQARPEPKPRTTPVRSKIEKTENRS